jgi:uncharacterized membrane protein YpjA
MTYYAWFIVFAAVAYFIVTDDSIAAAFYYVFRLAKAYIQRQWWWLTHNPANPVVKYFMWRRSMKLAKELQRHFDKNK